MADANGWTPTEARLLAVLADGQPHKRDELFRCLGDELAKPTAVNVHFSQMRRRLHAKGQDVLCRSHGHYLTYQHVRLLAGSKE